VAWLSLDEADSDPTRFLTYLVAALQTIAANIGEGVAGVNSSEGWIAGLQLAAISMQGHLDPTSFITSFTGSHHFVMDYLIEEVLHQQSESVQTFLLHTSILDRLCGPLCDAVLLDPTALVQETLEYLERANLFIVPLDNERRWYHHLFADLLRQRLQQSTASSPRDERGGVAEFHRRASQWYEDHSLSLGYLVFRSTFLPRILGVLLAIGALCYLTNSFAVFLAPGFAAHLFPYIQLPSLVGEGSLMLWLLVVGVNASRWEKQASKGEE
jgi:ATP/maltotriose-dependent transcriptional regulator MalT